MEWSGDVGQVDWIRTRLSPLDSGIATSVVPGGFEAYARIFHPASRTVGDEPVPVRWSEVAAWSGLPLRPDAQFPEIALPERLPVAPLPWDTGPEEGTLSPAYAAALGEILFASEGGRLPWSFGVWHGFGWETSAAELSALSASPGADAPEREEVLAMLGDPVPTDVRAGPTAELPGREYFLYSGGPGDALALMESKHQTPNLWWPSDHSWCLATDIDLAWTYVGGSSSLVAELVSDPRLEALAVSPELHHGMALPDWLAARVEHMASQIRRDAAATLETPYGDLRAILAVDETGSWRFTVHRGVPGRLGSGASWSSTRKPPSHESMVRSLAHAVIELVP